MSATAQTAPRMAITGPGVISDDASSPPAVQQPNAGDIVVTARRRDERLLDTPVAITAVGGARLARYEVTTVSDLASQVPSLLAGKAASGSSASIFLRGVGSTALSAAFDQSVSFVIDGLAMSRGREISLPQFDVQQVEVLKGPQALYFGKNTTGGLISIRTNGPSDRLEAGIKGGYEFEARQKYVEGYVSGPLSDSLKVRVAARYSDSDGAFTNTAADTYTAYIPGQVRTRTSDRRGGAETFGVRGTAIWEPAPNLKFELKGGYSSVQDGGPSDNVERLCGGGRTTPLSANGIPPSPNADCAVNVSTAEQKPATVAE
ncbi:TonB-dependent receptor plug domain-containing protein [Novosphingobium sp. GV055]|nr:TonB-dependent receptor plug domain-containing protein [Novosphingobium sp. GV055]